MAIQAVVIQVVVIQVVVIQVVAASATVVSGHRPAPAADACDAGPLP
ncbi:MAG: hypothetical protein ACKOCM_09235 [Cyanobacteriota bacterium]